MSDPQPSSSSPIQNDTNHTHNENSVNKASPEKTSNANNSSNIVRRERPARECTKRAAARLQAAAAAEAEATAAVRKKKSSVRKQRLAARLLRDEEDDDEEKFQEGDEEEEGEEGENGSPSSSKQQCGKIVTQLVGEPEPSQLPRWNLRGMWQLASVLNFLNVFRPLLNIKVEFSAEEFETALITPNDTLGDIHMPLLKAIPPVTRMALGHNTWITVLCRKLRDWWHWVAEGELPIVASQGAEIESYNALDPAVRVVILKALCDIRVEQEDIRNYIDDSLKQGVHLSLFRKERIGGDSHGISYWYEDDPIIGHRLYREIRKIEVKKGKGKNVQPIPSSCYQWETAATNLDEFQDVSEKLFTSQNRTEVSVGKKLKNNMLPEIEKVQRRKEKLLKKQHRQALMLDNMLHMDGLGGGRSLRDRKPVTYTFDDYDRSINDAIKITKKNQSSPEHNLRREPGIKHETSTNGRQGSPSHSYQRVSFRVRSPKSPEYDEYDEDHDEDHDDEQLDRSDRRRQRPQRYSATEFVEAISENEADSDSDDDIVGEVVYDDEYLRKRKRGKASSSSEGDDEYRWDEENPEDEEEDEDEQDSPSASEESDEPRKFRKLPGRTRRETKSRSVGNLQSGLRRSKRATRNRINYRHYELSESEAESMQPEKSNESDEHYDDASDNDNDNAEFSMASEGSEENDDNQEVKVEQPVDVPSQMETADQNNEPKRTSSPDQDDVESGGKRRFLDLNELAPGSGFDDGPNSVMKDEGADDF